MRILIVDDEPLAVLRIEHALDGFEGVEVVGSAADTRDAAEAVRKLRPDLILLDIEMPGATGLEFAATLVDAGPDVVFVTAFEHYAARAFEVEAVDYLIKPFEDDRLHAAVHRAMRRAAGDKVPSPSAPAYDQAVWAPTKTGSVRVPVESLEWVEAAGDYVLLHTAARSHLLRGTLTALGKRLDPAVIPRVHRSAMVRLAAVTEVRRGRWGRVDLVLESGSIVGVGEMYQEDVEMALGQL